MRRVRPGKRFLPSFDILEGRTLPAGNITAIWIGGHLRLEGDGEANQIRIVPAANHGVTITGLDGETINGQAGPRTIERVKSLAVALGDGDDVLEIQGLSLKKTLAVNGGAGSDTITFTDVRTRKDTYVLGGDGDDSVTIDGGRVRKKLVVFLDAGDDTLNLTGTRFGRKSYLDGGDGDDTLNAADTHWGPRTKVVNFENRSSTVTPPGTNDAPVANADTSTVTLGGTTTINVAANDTDADGTLDLTSVVVTQQPTHGTATANADGTVTYTHTGTDLTTDSFQYTIKDNDGATSNAATVSISVTATTQAPVANADTGTVVRGGTTTIDVAANDTAPAGTTLNLASVVIFQNPAHGTVTVNNDGTVTYVNNGNAATTDSFQYTIKNSVGTVSNVATVNITVTAANQAPVAANDTATVVQGGTATVNVAANDTDADGTLDLNSVTIVAQPTHGTATANADGTVTYQHDDTNTTSDTFTYTIKDNQGATSNTATVTVTVTPHNLAPAANDDVATVARGGTVTVSVLTNDTDSDGTLNPASVTITTPATNGTAVVNADGTITYTHDGSATTSDSFAYTVNDNDGATSNVATVNITVTTPNQAPIAADDMATVVQGGTATVNVAANDTDADGTLDLTSVTITQLPAHGTATANPDGTVTYVHDNSATTGDSFQYTIRDNQGVVSNAATVSITITPPNQAPVANDDSAFVTPFGQAFINVAANDTDADGTIDPTSITITQQPQHGTLFVNSNGFVTYVNDDPQAGTDSFRYTIKDNLGATSNEATVTITVNLAPVATNDTATVVQGGSTVIDVAANDADVDGTLNLASVTITAQPSHGSVVVNGDGTVTYTHDGSDKVADSFAYTINDNNGVPSNQATVTITVTFPNNTPPVANGDALFAPTGGSATANVLANDFDLNGTLDPATVVVTVQPANGTAVVNPDGTITYTHAGGGNGFDSFRYTVKDNLGAVSNEASVSVFIHDAPLAADDSGVVTQGGSVVLAILANDSASGGAVIKPTTVTIVQPPAHGTLTVNADGTVTYQHDNTPTSSDSFTYTVQDSTGLTSNVGTVSITILPPDFV